MKITRKQLRQLIMSEDKDLAIAREGATYSREADDLSKYLDRLIKAKDKDGLISALKGIKRMHDHYSEAEILQ